jgi:hypothetical protein
VYRSLCDLEHHAHMIDMSPDPVNMALTWREHAILSSRMHTLLHETLLLTNIRTHTSRLHIKHTWRAHTRLSSMTLRESARLCCCGALDGACGAQRNVSPSCADTLLMASVCGWYPKHTRYLTACKGVFRMNISYGLAHRLMATVCTCACVRRICKTLPMHDRIFVRFGWKSAIMGHTKACQAREYDNG